MADCMYFVYVAIFSAIFSRWCLFCYRIGKKDGKEEAIRKLNEMEKKAND